jgi:2-dehydropantoate 2-reductase
LRTLTKALHSEARACFQAAGISYLTQKDINARCEETGVDMQANIPGIDRIGGSTLQSLLRATGNIETDYLNGEIVDLGRKFDIPTPANATMLEISREIVAKNLPVGHFILPEILQRIKKHERKVSRKA